MPRLSASRISATPSSSLLAPYTPESDMQPRPIADTAMPEEPRRRLGSFSDLFMSHPFMQIGLPRPIWSSHVPIELALPILFTCLILPQLYRGRLGKPLKIFPAAAPNLRVKPSG